MTRFQQPCEALCSCFGLTTGLRTGTLPPLATLLSETALRQLEVETERCGLLRSEVWRKSWREK